MTFPSGFQLTSAPASLSFEDCHIDWIHSEEDFTLILVSTPGTSAYTCVCVLIKGVPGFLVHIRYPHRHKVYIRLPHRGIAMWMTIGGYEPLVFDERYAEVVGECFSPHLQESKMGLFSKISNLGKHMGDPKAPALDETFEEISLPKRTDSDTEQSAMASSYTIQEEGVSYLRLSFPHQPIERWFQSREGGEQSVAQGTDYHSSDGPFISGENPDVMPPWLFLFHPSDAHMTSFNVRFRKNEAERSSSGER